MKCTLQFVHTVASELLFGLLYSIPFFCSGSWGAMLLNDAIIYLVAMPWFLLVMRFIPDGAGVYAKPAHFGPWAALLTLVATLGMLYAGGLVTDFLLNWVDALIGMAPQDPVGDIVAGMGALLPTFILACAVPAVGEEFLFRYTLRKKMRGAGDWNFMLLSAVCFSLFHANLQQLPYTFLAGLAFAWVYVRTEKVWVSMALHLTVNTLGSIVIPGLSPFLPEWVFLVFTLACIVGAAVIFVLFCLKIMAGLRLPAEPGWPCKKRFQGRLAIESTAIAVEQPSISGQSNGEAYSPADGTECVSPRSASLFRNSGMVLYIVFALCVTVYYYLLPFLNAIG